MSDNRYKIYRYVYIDRMVIGPQITGKIIGLRGQISNWWIVASIKKKFMILEMEKTVSETGYDSWSIIILDSGETNFQPAWLRWKEVNSESDSEKVYGVQSQGYIYNLWKLTEAIEGIFMTRCFTDMCDVYIMGTFTFDT